MILGATKKGRTTFFFFPVFYCCFWVRDPGWKKIRIRDEHPESAALNKRKCFCQLQRFFIRMKSTSNDAGFFYPLWIFWGSASLLFITKRLKKARSVIYYCELKILICIHLGLGIIIFVKSESFFYPTVKKNYRFVAEGILPHEDLPPQRGPTGRDLRQHPQEGLETRPGHQGDIIFKYKCCSWLFRYLLKSWSKGGGGAVPVVFYFEFLGGYCPGKPKCDLCGALGIRFLGGSVIWFLDPGGHSVTLRPDLDLSWVPTWTFL